MLHLLASHPKKAKKKEKEYDGLPFFSLPGDWSGETTTDIDSHQIKEKKMVCFLAGWLAGKLPGLLGCSFILLRPSFVLLSECSKTALVHLLHPKKKRRSKKKKRRQDTTRQDKTEEDKP